MKTKNVCGTSGDTESEPEDSVNLPPAIGRIFPINSEFLQKSKKCISKREDSASNLLLEGSSNTYRTALLFQAAISFTIEGADVCFICPTPFTKLPPGVHGMNQPNPSSAQRLKMMYLSSAEELVSFLASVHQIPACPEVLVIDDFNNYISQNEAAGLERSAACLCAHLVDALHIMETKSETKRVHLIVGSDTINTAVSEIFPQFFQAVYSLKECADQQCLQMVPVCATRHQTASAKGQSPLVDVKYTFSKGYLCISNIYLNKSKT